MSDVRGQYMDMTGSTPAVRTVSSGKIRHAHYDLDELRGNLGQLKAL